jgi:hypothetical protein
MKAHLLPPTADADMLASLLRPRTLTENVFGNLMATDDAHRAEPLPGSAR